MESVQRIMYITKHPITHRAGIFFLVCSNQQSSRHLQCPISSIVFLIALVFQLRNATSTSLTNSPPYLINDQTTRRHKASGLEMAIKLSANELPSEYHADLHFFQDKTGYIIKIRPKTKIMHSLELFFFFYIKKHVIDHARQVSMV